MEEALVVALYSTVSLDTCDMNMFMVLGHPDEFVVAKLSARTPRRPSRRRPPASSPPRHILLPGSGLAKEEASTFAAAAVAEG